MGWWEKKETQRRPRRCREQKKKHNKTDSSLERQKKALHSRNKSRRPPEGLCRQFELLEIKSVIAEMFKKSVVELEYNVKRATRWKKAWKIQEECQERASREEFQDPTNENSKRETEKKNAGRKL